GILVREVEPGTPAAQAGLRNGDLIVKVGDQPVKDFDALVNALSQHKIGEKVNFQVQRDGKEQSFEVTLGQRPERRAGEAPRRQPTAFLGVRTEELTPEMKNQYKVTVDRGAVVVGVMPGTPAATAGLKEGDVITSVNNQPIENPQQLRQAVQQAGI